MAGKAGKRRESEGVSELQAIRLAGAEERGGKWKR